MNCQISQAIELVKKRSVNVYEQIQEAIEKHAEVKSDTAGFTVDSEVGTYVTAMPRIPIGTTLGSDESTVSDSYNQIQSKKFKEELEDVLIFEGLYVKFWDNHEETIDVLGINIVKKGKIINIIRTRGDTLQLHNENGVWSTKDGDVAPDFDEIFHKTLQQILGSDEEAIDNKREESLRKNALKSIDGMKAIIDELDDADEGYKKYVKGLIDMIGPEFIRNKSLYLNKDAQRNSGTVDMNGIVINIAPNMDYSDKTATEVYAHELMHAITRFAIESKDLEVQTITRQLTELRNQAAKIFSWKDFMPTQSLNKTADKVKAQARYEYIFENINSRHEFLAYGMTNKKVMSKLKANKTTFTPDKDMTLFDKLQVFVQKLLNVALGKVKWSSIDKNMKAQLHQLTFELMVHNGKAIKSTNQKNLNSTLDAVAKSINIGNKKISQLFNMVTDAFAGDPDARIGMPNFNAGVFEKTAYMLKMLPKLAVREDLRGIREVVISSFGLSPEGVIQNIMRDVEGNPSSLERDIEHLAMASDGIDRVRELTVVETTKTIREKFGELTSVEDEAITLSLLDTDVGVLLKDYSIQEIGGLLSNPEALEKRIVKVKNELRKIDSKNFFWNINQATGLGFYLATGKAGVAQNLNAYNIASGILTVHRRKARRNVVEKVDELATLVGIKYTFQDSNELVSKLIAKNPDAVKYVLELNEGIKKDAREQIFETDVNIIKGYSKEIFDDTIDVRIRPLSEKAIMEYNGFELVKVLDGDTGTMALYRSKMYVNSSYNRGASRITNIVKRGTSLTDISFTDDYSTSKRALQKEIKRIRYEAYEEVAKMQSGEYTPDTGNTLSPVLNQDGLVMNYRYMMGKVNKKELLGQDTKATAVMGRTLGSIRDKVDTDIQNKLVLEVIQKDMKTNYVKGSALGRNNQQYIKIENNSPNTTVSEIYKLLPEHMKEAIRDSDNGFIAVRRDMLHNYFGFRDMSILDFKLVHGVTPDVLHKWVKYAEKMWQQIVSISKVDIVIRTPVVFIGNVISNFMYSVVNGTSPLRVLKMQVRNMQAIKDYLDVQAEVEKLRIAGLVGKDSSKRISMLERELKSSAVADLMEAGMYQAIVEDLKKQDIKSSNKVVRKIEYATDSLPEYVKNGANWLYLGKGTGFFDFMTTATQYSDFIARATEYQLLRERGVSQKVALDNVLDVFINYGKPASSFEEYLNNMGLFMFTKYMKRITRVVHKSIHDKPLNVLLSVFAQEAFFEVDDIQDQNILTRSFSNLHQDMFKHFDNAITPTSLQFLGILK
jgi:hypothetical protein